MLGLGTFELVIVLLIIILLFGVGRIGKIAGELGQGINAFRSGLKSTKDDIEDTDEGSKQA